MNTVEKHLFKDCDEIFKLKHDIFLEDYLYPCLLAGDALNHTPLYEVDLNFNSDQYELSNCLRIVNSLINSQPLISVQSRMLDESFINFDIYYINNFEDIEDFYCIKSVLDFMIEGVMLYQIFEVKVKSLDMLNDFWITYE